MTAKTEAERLAEKADLYDDIICRLKFEPLTRAEQYAQIDRAVAAERERCARVCEGIGAGHTGAARRLDGQAATHAAGMRDGSNQCAAAIRAEAKGE